MKNTLPGLAILIPSLFATATSGAAVLANITLSGQSVSSVNLSTEGTTNWAAWNSVSNAESGEIIATNSKDEGIGTFSSITRLEGSTNVRSTNSTGAYTNTFTWTTSDESANSPAPSGGILTGVFNSSLTNGAGVQFSLSNLPTLMAGQTYQINVYTTGFRAQGTLKATLGSTTVSQVGTEFVGTKSTDVFSLSYNPDALLDELLISLETTAVNTGNSHHSIIQAVTVSVIPEPSGMMLTLTGVIFALGTRRRR